MIKRNRLLVSALLAFSLSLNAVSARADGSFLSEAELLANAAAARAAKVARAILRSRGVSPRVAGANVATREAAATATRTAGSVGQRAATFSAEAAEILTIAGGALTSFMLMTDDTVKMLTGEVPTAANDVDVKRVESLDQAPAALPAIVVNSREVAI